jgi:dephospho-CoA kinase
MKTIGITGGIASGKSLVSNYLKSLGARVICADEITHKLYLPKEAGSKLVKKEFGIEYLKKDGGVDRNKLGKLVFGDEKLLEKLNKMMHPLIFDEIRNQSSQEDKTIFVDAALLIESGLYKKMDEVWLVVANLYERIRRLRLRDNINDDKIMKIINSQMDDIEKSKYADKIIDNSFSIKETYLQVERYYSALTDNKKG